MNGALPPNSSESFYGAGCSISNLPTSVER
jgi:hypothetical protein